MRNKDEVYTRITAKDNNEYICPYGVTQGSAPLGMDQLDDCIEAEVVGRYIGNLKIVGSDES